MTPVVRRTDRTGHRGRGIPENSTRTPPACDLAAPWVLLPDGPTDRFHGAYRPTPDEASVRRARGWATLRALSCILIGEAGVHGRPGGRPTWGPPARATLRRLIATAP